MDNVSPCFFRKKVRTIDRKIEVKVRGSYMSKDSRNAGVQHEGNVTFMRIEFDEGWDAYAKTVTFWNALMGNPVKRILTTNMLEDLTASTRIYLVPIPPEAMEEAGNMTFVIDGYTVRPLTENHYYLTVRTTLEAPSKVVALQQALTVAEAMALEGRKISIGDATYTVESAMWGEESSTLTLTEPVNAAAAGNYIYPADGKRQRSISGELWVTEAPYEENAAESVEPTPSQSEQLQVQLDGVLIELRESTLKAEEYAKWSEFYAGRAEAYADDARVSKEICISQEESAAKSAASAIQSAWEAAESARLAALSVKEVEANVEGDFLETPIYDPQNKHQDIFAYAEAMATKGGLPVVAATSTDGAAYFAVSEVVTELKEGMAIVLIPNIASTKQIPTLDINNLGAVELRRQGSSTSATGYGGLEAGWLVANYPVMFLYSGGRWIAQAMTKVRGDDLWGHVPVANGGTGATTAAEALANLGALSRGGGTLTGQVMFDTPTLFSAFGKKRTIGETNYMMRVGIGSYGTGGTLSLRLATVADDGTETIVSQFDIDDGGMTWVAPGGIRKTVAHSGNLGILTAALE